MIQSPRRIAPYSDRRFHHLLLAQPPRPPADPMRSLTLEGGGSRTDDRPLSNRAAKAKSMAAGLMDDFPYRGSLSAAELMGARPYDWEAQARREFDEQREIDHPRLIAKRYLAGDDFRQATGYQIGHVARNPPGLGVGVAWYDIPFHDESSLRNFEKVMRGERQRHGCNPLVVVSADRDGLGTTSLVRAMIQCLHPAEEKPLVTPWPCTDDGMRRLIDCAAATGCPYLWFDNADSLIKSSVLSAVAGSAEWQWRPPCTTKLVRRPLNLSIYISGRGFSLAGDLMRRAWIIGLTGKSNTSPA